MEFEFFVFSVEAFQFSTKFYEKDLKNDIGDFKRGLSVVFNDKST